MKQQIKHHTTTPKMSSSTIMIILSLITFSSITTIASPLAGPTQQNSFLSAHNQARAQVGVGPLVWSDSVAAYAAEYGRRRSGDCQMEHSAGPYGENLAEGSGRLSAADAVAMWAGERSCYDYETNACVGGECMHYTQVVWNESTRLGCARTRCRNNGWWFVVCSYDPPGNYVGERPYVLS